MATLADIQTVIAWQYPILALHCGVTSGLGTSRPRMDAVARGEAVPILIIC